MPTEKPARGRPAEIDPERLLDVAQKLFSERGFDGTTTRELAKRARCNVAMIAYHFECKAGLYDAILERHFRRLHESLSAVTQGLGDEAELKRRWPELKNSDERRLCATLHAAGTLVLLDNEVHKILSREMMAGGRKIAEVMKRTEGGVAMPLRRCLEELEARGRLRAGIDWRFAVISLVGPLVYSCIARPLVKIVYGLDHDEQYVRRLCLHLTRTFFEGSTV